MRLLRKRANTEALESKQMDYFAMRSKRERCILDEIGTSTDPLADETLRMLDWLPEVDRALFMQNVLRRLVVQALDTAQALDIEHAQSLRHRGVFGYATRISGRGYIRDTLANTVIHESLPNFEQGELPL